MRHIKTEYSWSNADIEKEIIDLNNKTDAIASEGKAISKASGDDGNYTSSNTIVYFTESMFDREEAYERIKYLSLILDAREMMNKAHLSLACKIIDELEQTRIYVKDYARSWAFSGSLKQCKIFRNLYDALVKAKSKDEIINSLKIAIDESENKLYSKNQFVFTPYCMSDKLRNTIVEIKNRLEPGNKISHFKSKISLLFSHKKNYVSETKKESTDSDFSQACHIAKRSLR